MNKGKDMKLKELYKVIKTGKSLKEYDDFQDPVSAGRMAGKASYEQSGEQLQDAIEYAGGQEEWDKLSSQEKQKCLDFVSSDRDRSQQFESNKRFNEGSKDLKKVDRSNLVSNAERILDAFIKEGFRGTYDPQETTGKVTGPGGIIVEFTTGGENLYLKIEQIHTKDVPEKTIKELRNFLEFVTNYW